MCTLSWLRVSHPLPKREQDTPLFPSTVCRASGPFSSLPSAKAMVSGVLTLWKGFLRIFKPRSLRKECVGKRQEVLKGLVWGNGLGEPEEMERRRKEKATYEWGRGGCNSWMEVNATAGGD